jgi:hypothetical protein
MAGPALPKPATAPLESSCREALASPPQPSQARRDLRPPHPTPKPATAAAAACTGLKAGAGAGRGQVRRWRRRRAWSRCADWPAGASSATSPPPPPPPTRFLCRHTSTPHPALRQRRRRRRRRLRSGACSCRGAACPGRRLCLQGALRWRTSWPGPARARAARLLPQCDSEGGPLAAAAATAA